MNKHPGLIKTNKKPSGVVRKTHPCVDGNFSIQEVAEFEVYRFHLPFDLWHVIAFRILRVHCKVFDNNSVQFLQTSLFLNVSWYVGGHYV